MLRALFRRRRTSADTPAVVEPQTWDAPPDAEFVEQVTSVAMRARYQELRRDRPEVRALEYMFGWPRVLEWVHSVGVVQDERLRALVPPLPPRALRSITAEPELEPFLWTGLAEARLVLEAHARHARARGRLARASSTSGAAAAACCASSPCSRIAGRPRAAT